MCKAVRWLRSFILSLSPIESSYKTAFHSPHHNYNVHMQQLDHKLHNYHH
ncbi:Hypothetical protein FKW44_006014 [Caligus rogercresseyi]|uniref:Uncharacterized protein n=1 Tax=Caligus rogercresseyi TaxID=217165 RepID=A0A7T8QSI5_CALRO|nr:Hypothetical protein FKW44_006014 [Caligus rogercresseyi]